MIVANSPQEAAERMLKRLDDAIAADDKHEGHHRASADAVIALGARLDELEKRLAALEGLARHAQEIR